MTFHRQSRSSFPTRNIALLAAVVLAFLVFLLRSVPREAETPLPAPAETQRDSGELRDTGLWPAEWFYALRDYPRFRPDVQAFSKALSTAKNAAAQRSGLPGFSAPWTVQGPGNIGARINTIKVHPTNPDIIYIGYSGGGVWKTTDGGQSWNAVFDQQTFLAIGDIELDPQNPEIVYVGTGDPNISGYPFIGDGLWRSPDGGQSWQHLGLENQRIISKIIIHPANPDVLLVGTMGLPFARDNQRGLYRSTDGGQSWQQTLFVADSVGVIDMALSPDNPDVLYAATWDRIRNNQESVVSGLNARVWKSIDKGLNWTPLTGGLPETARSRPALAVDPADGDRVLAMFAGENLGFDAIYETTDGGNNWQQLPVTDLNPGFQSNFAWYFGKIFINPFDNQDVWALGVHSVRSWDAGYNWYDANDWETHADHHDLAFLGPQSFLLATDGGLYRSDDGGNAWTKIENVPATQFYRVGYNPHQPALYYGGAQDNGSLAGNASGLDEWLHLYGGDGFQPVFHPFDPGIFYFEWQNGNIVGTVDGGGWFDNATAGIDPSDRRHWDMQYLLSPHDPDVFFTGTYRVYQGFGHPPGWAPVSDDLTDGVIFGERYHTISTLDESPLTPNLLYAGTTDGNVWRGELNSQTWTNVTAGLPDRYVSCVKGSPGDPDRVFVSHTGYRDGDFTALVHRSDDRGDTWVAISGDLPPLAVNDLLILPGHQDSILFAATDGGVYGTLDGGQHWERLGAGLPFVPVYDLDLNVENRTLMAGTHARSILSFPLDSLQTGGESNTFSPQAGRLPRLIVTPSLASGGAVTVAAENLKPRQLTELFIVNLAGQICAQEQFGGQPNGVKVFDSQKFAPGVYVAFARTNGKMWGQKKFVVTR